MTIPERAPLGGFSHVDADPTAAAPIAALDTQASPPAIQRLRASAVELLRPRLGDRLLDVGCGTGEVVRALAGLLGPHGTVVGSARRPTMASFSTMADTAANAGATTGAEAAAWLAELADAGTTGSFFWAVTMFAVGGVRQSPSSANRAAKEEDQ